MPPNQHHKQKTSNKPRHIKYHNQKLILSMFLGQDVLSIAEIAARINLSKTTVTKVVNNFEKKGLVLAAGKGNSTDAGGKKPEMFAFNASYSYVMTAVINPAHITCAIMDLKCRVIQEATVNCSPKISYGDVIQSLVDSIHGLIKETGLKFDKFHPIVIGCEGIIDADNGIIHYPLHHRWGQNLPLCKDLARALSFSTNIYIDNNLRLSGYADMIMGAASCDSQAVIITTTISAGGSILENQQLVHGINGFVGEVGHMILEPNSDIRCNCGGRGCFGALISPGAVLGRAHKRCSAYLGSSIYSKTRDKILKMADVFEAANQKDPFACELMNQVIDYFAIVIHNIVLLRDPAKIIIHGIYTAAGDYFLKNLRKKVNSLPFYKMKRDLPISYTSVSQLNSCLVGAGIYAVNALLDINSLYD
jgi:predicted NBD/HSP70 family sugar kinase